MLKVPAPADRRVLHYGDKGRDVLAYQRALTKTMYALGEFPVNRQSGLYGKGTLSDTLRLQKRLGIPVDGKVGPLTWTAIDPKLDLYGKALLTPRPKPPTPPGVRVAHQARVMAALAPRHYTQRRPYAGSRPLWMAEGGDCSGTSILIYKLAGCPDPNGTSYDGSGWTGSLIKRGVHVPLSLPGDLCFYGPGLSEHVVVAVSATECVSHGSEGGPRVLPISYRGDFNQARRYV
jgi:hypothetical protein